MIGIRELPERLSQDCFNNPFSPDSGTPAKNIPPLYEVDDGDKVSTCHALNFSSCIYCSTVASTISDITQYSASSISIGSQHISEIEEAREGGRYNRITIVYYSGRLTNGKIFLNRILGFARDVTGSTIIFTIFEKLAVIVLQHIMNPLFISLDMFSV